MIYPEILRIKGELLKCAQDPEVQRKLSAWWDQYIAELGAARRTDLRVVEMINDSKDSWMDHVKMSLHQAIAKEAIKQEVSIFETESDPWSIVHTARVFFLFDKRNLKR